jgi:hypothetical protein
MDVGQRSLISYYRFKQRGYRRIHTKLVGADGSHAYLTGSVKCWVREYDRGGQDCADSPRAGRPRSDIAEAVSHILREQPFSSTKYIAAQLGTTRDLVRKTLVEVLGMKKFSLRWVPHELTVAQKRQRIADSRRLFQSLIADGPNEFTNIITVDESWYYWVYQHSSQWSTSRDLVPTRTLQKIDSKKSMFPLIFGGHGLLTLDELPKWCKMNSQYFCDVVLEGAKRSVTAITGKGELKE